MELALSIAAMALVAAGLIGQGFVMNRIRKSIRADEQLSSKNIFADRRNFKWYALIAAGLVLSFLKI